MKTYRSFALAFLLLFCISTVSAQSPDNISSVNFFDTKTYYLIQTIQEIEMQGQMSENITVFSDYKKINKYAFPNKMDMNLGGGQLIMTLTFTKVELNIPVDEIIFTKPQENPI